MVIQRHDAWEGGSSGKVAATSLRDSDEHDGAPVMTVDMRSRGMRICVLLARGNWRGEKGVMTVLEPLLKPVNAEGWPGGVRRGGTQPVAARSQRVA
jgi:hypothetical protein